MTWRSKTVIYSAVIGFTLPALMIFYYIVSTHFGSYPNMDALFSLCPTSIMSMGLDKSSTSTAFIVWFCICLSNAFLYAIPTFLLVLFTRIWKHD